MLFSLILIVKPDWTSFPPILGQIHPSILGKNTPPITIMEKINMMSLQKAHFLEN
jgi:hypothetical protein